MARVIALGGVFLKCKDPKKLGRWYQKHLGISTPEETVLMFPPGSLPKGGHNLVAFFEQDTAYFRPSRKGCMLNLVVDDLDGLVKQLRRSRQKVQPEIAEFKQGKFGWVVDPEGNKVELWEPAAKKRRRS